MIRLLILNLEWKENNLYAQLVGSLTKNSVYKFDQYVIPYMKQNQIQNFFCDCTHLKKIDFEGKGILLKTKLELKKQKGSLFLCHLKEELKNELVGYRMRIQS